LKKIFEIIIIGFLCIFCFSGCYSAGKATGKAVQTIEKGVEEFRNGYKDQLRMPIRN